MKVKFFVRGNKNPQTIYVRVWDSKRFDQTTRTGLIAKKKEFSNKTQKMRNVVTSTSKDFNNSKLKQLETFLIDNYNVAYSETEHLGKEWLKHKVNVFFGRASSDTKHTVYFNEWLQKFIEQAPKILRKGKLLAPKTLQNYSQTFKQFDEYEKVKDLHLKFTDINLKFYFDFVDYLRNDKHYGDSTIGSYIARLKTFCKQIEQDGYKINQQYKSNDFAVMTGNTKDVYLNEAEIQKIVDFDFSYSERLSNSRDLLVMGLHTALRVSDLMRLDKTNFDSEYIDIIQKKTGHTVLIPLHPNIKQIIKNRGGKLPRMISEQKFNKSIKDVCKVVGITEKVQGSKSIVIEQDGKRIKRKQAGLYPKYELVSSHTCRRSFASNMYGKIPHLHIMACTGHKSEKQFLDYIKITPKEHAKIVAKLWDEGEKIEVQAPLRKVN